MVSGCPWHDLRLEEGMLTGGSARCCRHSDGLIEPRTSMAKNWDSPVQKPRPRGMAPVAAHGRGVTMAAADYWAGTPNRQMQ